MSGEDVSYVRDPRLISPSNPVKIPNPNCKEAIVRVLLSTSGRSFKVLKRLADFRRVYGQMVSEGGDLPRGRAAARLPWPTCRAWSRIAGSSSASTVSAMAGSTCTPARPITKANGKQAVQRDVVELTVRRPERGNPPEAGLSQLDRYLEQIGIDTEHLIAFDRRPNVKRKLASPEFSSASTPDDRAVSVLPSARRQTSPVARSEPGHHHCRPHAPPRLTQLITSGRRGSITST